MLVFLFCILSASMYFKFVFNECTEQEWIYRIKSKPGYGSIPGAIVQMHPVHHIHETNTNYKIPLTNKNGLGLYEEMGEPGHKSISTGSSILTATTLTTPTLLAQFKSLQLKSSIQLYH